ncbi:MAG: NPCBM/NEW2 domain-containing protein [Planctomycetota bacterium]|nr:NPCBM/NEW2 domain-containing protein [Planctomycetota bacterium]
MADFRFLIPDVRCAAVLLAIVLLAASLHAADPAHYIRKDTWQETMLASRTALMASQKEAEKNGGTPTFATGVMLGGDAAQNIKVKVAGWKELYLIVDDDGDYNHDVANWAEAKLIAKDGASTWLDTIEPSSAQQG